MKIFFTAAGVVCLWMTLLAQDASPKQESRTPFMVSLTDLKWVELPERKGMQFAILSGDPKTGPYTQMRTVPAGTDNGAERGLGQRFRPRLSRGHAGRLDAREWLPCGNRLPLLSRG